MKRFLFASAALSALLVGAILGADRDGGGRNMLRGTWKAISAERNGAAANDIVGHRLDFSGERFVVHDQDGQLLYQGTYLVDPRNDPATIDFNHSASSLQSKRWQGIYQCNGDELKICDNAGDPSKHRPTDFTTMANSGQVAILFERVAR